MIRVSFESVLLNRYVLTSGDHTHFSSIFQLYFSDYHWKCRLDLPEFRIYGLLRRARSAACTNPLSLCENARKESSLLMRNANRFCLPPCQLAARRYYLNIIGRASCVAIVNNGNESTFPHFQACGARPAGTESGRKVDAAQ